MAGSKIVAKANAPLDLNVIAQKLWRGRVIELVYLAAQNNREAYSHTYLHHVMQDEGQGISLNCMIFTLRLLKDCGYLEFQEERDMQDNEVSIIKIRITPKGVQVYEKDIIDPSVTII